MRHMCHALVESAAVLACIARIVNGQGAPLTITCSTRTVFVDNPNEQVTVTLDAPGVTTAGGMPPVTISPTPPVPPTVFSHTGTAGSSLVEEFTATDGDGNTQSCSVVLQVVLGGIPGAPLTITCNTRTVFVDNPNEQVTVTLDAPGVTTAGGTPPVTISPAPPVPPTVFSHTGTAGSSLVEDFTATDGDGNTQSCSVVLQVVLGGIPEPCDNGDAVCDDPHMQGLRGQKIDWSGNDGAWYSLIRDDAVHLQVNIRLNAPLPDEFPNRQLITGMSVLSQGHSLVIEVKDPYSVSTGGCSDGIMPCLCDGALRVVVDGRDAKGLLHFIRDAYVSDGITMSASNLPVECRQFGAHKIWARMYDEMLQGSRWLSATSFEDWVLSFDTMAAPDWCAKFIAERGLTNVQSTYAIFKIVTPTVVVRLNTGVNHQDSGEIDWDGRVLPMLDFWQMDIGLEGLSIDNESLSGILGETARPVLDDDGVEVMEGYDALRGTVADYEVVDALGTDFALLHKQSP